jgi:hypothetical protein
MARYESLEGKRIGKLIPLNFTLKDKVKHWVCQCDCGNTKVISQKYLRSGNVVSCGCDNKRKITDEVGNRYGNLVVLRQADQGKYCLWKWICRCDCGNEKTIVGTYLRNGHTKSCGCLPHAKGDKHQTFKGHKDIAGFFWGKIKKSAKKRQLEFNITIEYIWDLYLKQEKKCAISGENLKMTNSFSDTQTNEDAQTASLDRIDSSKGYVIGNVQWVHKHVNMMKQNYPQDYFVKLCKKIAAHNQ